MKHRNKKLKNPDNISRSGRHSPGGVKKARLKICGITGVRNEAGRHTDKIVAQTRQSLETSIPKPVLRRCR